MKALKRSGFLAAAAALFAAGCAGIVKPNYHAVQSDSQNAQRALDQAVQNQP